MSICDEYLRCISAIYLSGYMGVHKVVSLKQMFDINFLTVTSSNELSYWPFEISYLFILGEYCIMLHPKGNSTPRRTFFQ